jgi:hypothetical protein
VGREPKPKEDYLSLQTAGGAIRIGRPKKSLWGGFHLPIEKTEAKTVKIPAIASGTVPLTDVITIRAAAGRVSLPSNQFVRFEHISGMPAAGGEGGYSITKLRILDALLDRLAILKGERPKAETEGLSGAGLDKIIDEMQSYLRDALKNASSTPFTVILGGGAADNGLLFNYLV